MIHGRDEAVAVPSVRFEGRLRGLSGPAEGARRQYRDGGFRPVGLRDVFHAERVVSCPFSVRWRRARAARTARRLFGIEKIPSDNYIRDMLDEADPALLRPVSSAWKRCWPSRPMRQAFGRLGGRTLVAWDGTEYFCSQKLGCPHCLTRKRSNGKIENYHTCCRRRSSRPAIPRSCPLMPEFIATQDGAEKQDCERNAVKRWFGKHGARLAPLRPVYLGDDLFACQPVAKMVTDAGDDFIFTGKETSHKALYDFIDGAEPFGHEEKVAQGQDERDVPLSLDRGGSAARRQGRHARQLDRLRDRRRQGQRQIFHGLGDQPSRSQSTMSPKSSPAAGRAGRSRTKASTS